MVNRAVALRAVDVPLRAAEKRTARRVSPYGKKGMPPGPSSLGLTGAMDEMALDGGPVSSRTRARAPRFQKLAPLLNQLEGSLQTTLTADTAPQPSVKRSKKKPPTTLPPVPAQPPANVDVGRRRAVDGLAWHVRQNVLDLLDSFIRRQRLLPMPPQGDRQWKPLRARCAPPPPRPASSPSRLKTRGDDAAVLPPVRTHGGRALSEVRSSARLTTRGLTRPAADQPAAAVEAPATTTAGGGAAAGAPVLSEPSGASGGPRPSASDILDSATSFEAVLRVYYRSLTVTELEAMLVLCAPVLQEAIRRQWIADLKERCHEQIRAAFFMADEDGDGGLSLHEFAAAVALHRGERRLAADAGAGSSTDAHSAAAAAADAADAEETDEELQALFALGDRDGNGLLDEDEFYDLVSTSAHLRASFGYILAVASARRATRKAHEHALGARIIDHWKPHRPRAPFSRKVGRQLADRGAHAMRLPLVAVFEKPYSPMSHSVISPSGKRHRPNLSDLRRVRPSELEGQVPMPFGKLAGKATGRPRRI